MAMKLYVGNLSFQTSSYDLEELFGSVGTVESASVVEDRETGRSRGFGFVEMASQEEGEKAIAEFNGKEFAGREIKVGKFPFTASGKASASGSKDGFVKLIFDAAYGELIGAHMIGANVTEMISELVVARKLETTAHEIMKSVHPHPTMSEAIMEAAAAAYGEVIHL